MRIARALTALGMVVVAGVALGPQRAPAANASKPRVPVVWADAPCITVVDRSTTPMVHFEYSVPSEETGMLTTDEVSDSRRHQFFAFAAQRFEAAPPTWITQADIDRAAMVDPMVVPDAIPSDDVLETTSRWSASEWVRITPDDMRVPITNAQAAMGVDWDVSAVAPGTWLVKGYTWEPLRNLWSTRWSAVKVIASPADADAAGPSVILLPEEVQLETGVEHVLPGCIDAPTGSTLTLEYGAVEGSLEPDWQIAQDDVDVTTGPLAITFVPPDELAGGQVLLRATIRDSAGNEYVAYSPKSLPVKQGPETHDDGGGGGGCRIAPNRATLGGWLVVLAAALRWRRRRSH